MTSNEILDATVNEVQEISQEDIKAVLSGMVADIEAESRKSEPYKAMFDASHKGLRGILDEANSQMLQVIFATQDILKDKGFLPPCNEDDFLDYNKIYYTLQMLPLLFSKAEYVIDEKDGYMCVKDKQRHIIYEYFMKLMRVKENHKTNDNQVTQSTEGKDKEG